MAPGTKIFVGRLPASCRREELHDLFSKYGTVKECDILTNYGFVHMSTPEEASAAILGLHNYELDGTKITVEESTSRPRSKLPRSRGGGRGQRPQYRESYASQVGYQSQPWDRYGGRMRPYPDPYEDRRYASSQLNYSQSTAGYGDYYYDQRQPTPPPAQPPQQADGYGGSRDSYNRQAFSNCYGNQTQYSYDTANYSQYDPYGGASTWSNF